MKITRGFDRFSAVFGIAGFLWALFSVWLDKGWQWWLLGAIASAVAARLAVGRRIRPVAFAVGSAVLIAVLFGYLFGYPVFDDWRHRTAFDAALWRQEDTGAEIMWPHRLCMVDDLLRRHDLHGWERSRVVALLGEPDQTNWDREGQLVYRLGPERGLFRIDSEWLVLTLGADNRVTKRVIAND